MPEIKPQITPQVAPQIVMNGGGPQAAPGPGVRMLVVSGLLVVAAMVGGFAAWSMLAPLESAAVAPGSVSVEFNRKTIKHLEGGIVRHILVAEGETVRAGQLLIELDTTQARAQLELLRGRRAAATARYARLAAERDRHDRIRFPEWLENQRSSTHIADIIARQNGIFTARRAAMASQTAILTKRISQLDEEIKGLDGQIKSSRAGLAILNEELSIVAGLVKKGLARRPRMLELRRMETERLGTLSKAIAALARADQRIGETHLQIGDLHAVRNAEITQEMREVQTELLELSERLRVAEDMLARSRITAPLDGTVVGLQVHTVGGVVGPAEPLVHIVPADEKLIIEAQVDPIDIDVVRTGLTARVDLTPFNSRHSASLTGTVASVSADSLVEENSGRSYYLARIELDPQDPAMQNVALRPGMPAQVMIITGKHTIMHYLIKPITQSFNVAFREE
jgi:HlyD family type I secretion membrane fusion protein